MNGSERLPTYHVLLVGIDRYAQAPLAGCVNDIDAVQDVLRTRLALPDDQLRIRRLASPIPGAAHDPAIPEQPATLDNLHAALENLASDAVQPGDRVFIYYSGHGARVEVVTPDQRRLHREALVPVDCTDGLSGPRLLFDFELNELLRRIVQRTSSVVVMLDCCHAAGATRDGAVRSFDRGARDREPIADPARARSATRGPAAGDGAASVTTCQVVSACLANQLSVEIDPDGVRNGAFTSAFVAAVRGTAGDLRTLTWDRIWHAMQNEVALRNPAQNPRMEGSLRRCVFGGPPVDSDAGLSVWRDGADYRIAAGTMADITPDTELAIYGPEPARFPPLGSTVDRAIRLGVVRVTEAGPAEARATAIGPVFELPAGARGRVIKAGATSRLGCAVIPLDAAIEAELARSEVLELVGADPRAAVRLLRSGERWNVIDTPARGAATSAGADSDAPVLYAVPAGDAIGARAVLEHYVRYSLPLRVAARAIDLPGGLELRVLRCPDDRPIPPAEAQDPALSEAKMQDGRYRVADGGAICVAVRNRTQEELQVTLLNVSADGRVQLLGEASVARGQRHVFWSRERLGVPFKMRLVTGESRSRDRFVAIGRTGRDHDLRHLLVAETFQQIQIAAQKGAVPKPVGDDDVLTTALDRWTAAQAAVETFRP